MQSAAFVPVHGCPGWLVAVEDPEAIGQFAYRFHVRHVDGRSFCFDTPLIASRTPDPSPDAARVVQDAILAHYPDDA